MELKIKQKSEFFLYPFLLTSLLPIFISLSDRSEALAGKLWNSLEKREV